MSRFEQTYCSQCGKELGPGDAGVSHCSDHATRLDCLPVPTDRNQGWPGVYAMLYTDAINDEQTCRDDLWIATTAAIKAVVERAQQDAYAEGRKDETEATSSQQPVAYQQLVNGKWIECSYFVAFGWGEEISPNCRALYAQPPQTQAPAARAAAEIGEQS